MDTIKKIETQRLLLRPPESGDAQAIFERYGSDADVTRYVGWPRHKSLADTEMFLTFSKAEWERWSVGPYLIFSRADGQLLGGTGLSFDAPWRASTGYVLAKDAWGQGYATETLQAMVNLAEQLKAQRLCALCHPNHRASWRVLEKCDFQREGVLRKYLPFPNIQADIPADVLSYSRIFESA